MFAILQCQRRLQGGLQSIATATIRASLTVHRATTAPSKAIFHIMPAVTKPVTITVQI